MRLSDMDSKNFEPNVVIIQTPSVKLSMFIEDKIRRLYACTNDSTIDVRVKSDLKKVKEVLGITPPFSKRWYVPVDLDKFKDKELAELIKVSSTCVFVCTCSKYVTFKQFKDSLKEVHGVCDFYINYLKRPDFIYLYDAFVPEDKRLQKSLFDYVTQSYSGDIDVVFNLFLELAKGTVFKDRKAIADLCGIGGLSVESFIFMMLKPLSGSDKGLKKMLKLRIQAGSELAESMGYTKLYNFTAHSLMTLIQLKMLIISGDIYKEVRDLPESYDKNRLVRYQKYIWKLKTLPLSALLLLRQSMGDRAWRNEFDYLNFVYKYYKVLSIQRLNSMIEEKV